MSSEQIENTLTAYLGPEFQKNLMWQLLVEPEFAEKILPNIQSEYFDDPIMKRLFIIVWQFYMEYGKVPNLQNKTIHMAIKQFKTSNSIIEADSLAEALKRIELWNERVLNRKEIAHHGDVVRKAANSFIKQQEYRKIGEFIIGKTKEGKMGDKDTINFIEDKFRKTADIGADVEDIRNVFDNIDKVLSKEFRRTIPTGVEFIDAVTGGGLGRGEIGLILSPSGVGKTTLLTKIANTAYEDGRHVLQIIFEDTPEQIQRKHFSIWSGVPQSEMDDELENIRDFIYKKATKMKSSEGGLVLMRFSQEHTTIKDIRAWIETHQKKHGYKFDLLILDYLDCLEPNTRQPDRNEAELQIIKSFEAMASELDIPCWSAIQSNRSGFGSDFIEADQSGGSIKRIQKSHFFMSVAKSPEQKNTHFANVAILKARFAKDGQRFENCVFNNDSLEIRVEDDRFKQMMLNKGKKHHNTDDINKMEQLHSKISNNVEQYLISKANDDAVNDAPSDAVKESVFDDLRGRIQSSKGIDVNNEIRKITKEEYPVDTYEVDAQEEVTKLLSEPEQIPEVEENNIVERSVDDIENTFIDPDEPQNEHKTVHDLLMQSRENQQIMKDK